jgi:hypothetical protein
MADNTSKYTVEVEAEVTGGKSVEELGDQAEGAGDKFQKLQLQIRQTQKDLQAAAAAGDTVTFNKLKAQLDELEDGLEAVQLKSKQFDDQLASLPGPAGAAGNAIKSVDGAFKLFAANPAVAIIGALVGIFLALKRSLESTAEGQALLNRVSQAFAGVIGPILATLERFAIPVFEKVALVLEFVASGFSKAAQAMGISSSKIKEATLSVDKVQQDVNDKEKKRQEEATKKADDEAKKRAENAKKRAEERKAAEKKAAEDAAKNLADANKVLTEAYLATLTQRDQEIFKAGQAQNERLLALERAGIKDKTAVLEQGRLEQIAINKKYDDEEAKKVEEANKKKQEDDKKKAEEDKAKVDKKREDDLLGLDTQLEFDFLTFQQRKDLINQKEAELLTNAELTKNQRTAIEKAGASERLAIDIAEIQAKEEIQKAQLDLVAGFGSLLTQIAGKNKALAIGGIVLEQGAAIGKILVGASSSISQQIAAANAQAAIFPPAAPLIFANLARGLTMTKISAGIGIAGAIAGAVKGISAINQSGIPGGGGGAAASAGGGISIPAPQVGSMAAPQIQGTQAATPGSQIASTLSQTTNRPIKAYVVSGDVSSQQALDRRTSVAATFG